MSTRPTRIRCAVVAAIFPNNLADPAGPQGAGRIGNGRPRPSDDRYADVVELVDTLS